MIIEIEKVKADFAELNHQLKWEIVKYYIRKFTIDYSKKLAKETSIAKLVPGCAKFSLFSARFQSSKYRVATGSKGTDSMTFP